MLKLGLQKKTESEKLIKPGVITDNLWLRHSYNDGKAQTVGEGCVTLDGTADFMSLNLKIVRISSNSFLYIQVIHPLKLLLI